jgi:DNA-binding transcriptional LysR family regulator
VAKLHESHPALSISVVEDTSARMLELLDDGRLDLIVGRASVSNDPSKYHYRPIIDEPMSVVVGPGHPLKRMKNLTLAHLAEHRWITYPAHMPMHALLERELDLAGLPFPSERISTAPILLTITLLQQNPQFVSILPKAVAAMFAHSGMISVLPIVPKSRSQTMGAVTRKNRTLSRAARAFVELLLERGKGMSS